MRIYSSELLNNADVNEGNLTITAGDLINVTDVANGAYTSANAATDVFGTDPTAGLFIIGGAFDRRIGTSETLNTSGVLYHYIDGKGQQRQLNDVLIAQGQLSGSNLQLQNRAGTQVVADISLAGLSTAGGGGGAATNAANATLPVKFQDSLGNNVFLNSVITQTGTTTAPVTATAMVNGAPAMGANVVQIDNISAAQQTDFNTAFGTAVPSTTISIGGTQFVGTLESLTSGSTASFTLAAGNFDTSGVADGAAIILPVSEGVLGNEGARVAGNLEVTGNLQVTGTSTAVNQQQVDLNDSYLTLNAVNTADNTIVDFANADGGLFIVTDSVSEVLTLAGIRFDASANQFQVAGNLNAAGATAAVGGGTVGTDITAQNTWVPLSTAGGTTNKVVVNVATTTNAVTASFDGSAVTIANSEVVVVDIPSTDTTNTSLYAVNVDIATTAGRVLPLGTTDVTVAVYDNNAQIIPDEVQLGIQYSATTGASSSVATSIAVVFPADFNPSGTGLKIVIIG